MGKRIQTQIFFRVLMMLVLLLGMIPRLALASDEQPLGRIEFVSSSDSTLITGETTNIRVKLYQYETCSDPFTGSLSATITDSKGIKTFYSVIGADGDYSIQNVTLDTPGNYTLSVITNYGNEEHVERSLKVENAVSTITGSLFINTDNALSGKLADSEGKALLRKVVTIDGSTVGATAQSVTTLSDGTFTFAMRPTLYGTVKIIFAGHVIGTIPVVPAYTRNERIGGTAEDNVALSITIAKSGWGEGTRTVILARDDQFSDVMAAVPLSRVLNAPILMTASAKLDDRTLAEMQNLGVVNVYIVGGTVAISQGIQDSLSNEFAVTRIAGQEGYDTAALISSYVGMGDTHTVFIANGHAIPDAIAGSAFAAEQRSPILLTNQDSIPAATMQALTNLDVSNVVLLGGTAVISTQAENQLPSKYAVKRWGGNDRYDTQNVIFENLFNTSQTSPQSPLYFTSGLVLQNDLSSGKPRADSLLTAALAAKTGGFVAMLPQNNIPPSLYFFLLYNKEDISKSTVVGNNSGVSQDLEQQLQQILKR